MDYSSLTDEQLLEAASDVQAESAKRATQQRLHDNIWSAVLDAKNNGYEQAQVISDVTATIEQVFAIENTTGII